MSLSWADRQEMRAAAESNYLRWRATGGDLERDFNNTKVAEVNFYKSDCESVRFFREAVRGLCISP